MYALISNQLKYSNIDINPHVIPQVSKKGFSKGEALRLLRTSSSKILFEEKVKNVKQHLLQRGYPKHLIQKTLSEVKFEDRKIAFQQRKNKENKRILSFVTQYQPSVPNLKQILVKEWHLIENKPLLNDIFKEQPITSYKKGRSLKDILVREKLWKRLKHERGSRAGLSPPFSTPVGKVHYSRWKAQCM